MKPSLATLMPGEVMVQRERRGNGKEQKCWVFRNLFNPHRVCLIQLCPLKTVFVFNHEAVAQALLVHETSLEGPPHFLLLVTCDFTYIERYMFMVSWNGLSGESVDMKKSKDKKINYAIEIACFYNLFVAVLL